MQAIEPILPLWGDVSTGELRSIDRLDGPTVPFADIFQAAIDNVRETDAAKNEAAYLLATGQMDNPAEWMIASTQANMSLELLVELRNRALEAYSELTRISM